LKNVVFDCFVCYNNLTQTEMELHKMTTSQAVAQVVTHADTESKTVEELLEAMENLRQIMVANYGDNSGRNPYDVYFEAGSKYTRLYYKTSCQSHCLGFIVNTKAHKNFPFGTLLMSAGWKAPAMNKGRGNIFNLEGTTIQWTGIQ
jgi:hypothetical protein